MMLRLLFVVVLFDLFLGGGGRLVEVGPVTLRMLLFAVAAAVAVVYLAGRSGGLRSVDDQEWLALTAVVWFLIIHAGAVAIGWLHGYPLADIATDVKPLLFMGMAPFLALCIKTPGDVALAARLLRIAGPILAVAYLAVWAGLMLQVLDFKVIYSALNETGEFFFRGERFFFYKGFLYLGIGILFLLAHRTPGSLLLALLVAVALVLTLTRGFVLSTSIAVLTLLLLRDRRIFAVVLPVVAMTALLVLLYLPTLDAIYLEQRDVSNTVRVDDWLYFTQNVDLETLLFGRGFGAIFNDRLLFENSYLWLLWKGGLPVLAFWLAPFALATRWFIAAARSARYGAQATAWWCTVLLVYAQTATNPFLNNPIGLSIVLLAVLSLRVLALDATANASGAAPVGPRPDRGPLEPGRA